MAITKTYSLMTQFHGSLDEVLQDQEPAKVTLESVLASMKEMAFMLETLAHLQGKESTILPTTDKARAIVAELESN